MLPYLGDAPPWFAFLAHPRDMRDLHAVGSSSVIAEHSDDEDEFREKMLSLPPTVAGGITFGFSPVRGDLVIVFNLPDTILRREGRAAVAEGARLAVRRGAKVIGLGALTAPATRGGQTLVDELPRGVTLTTGNAFTAATALRNAAEAADALGLGTTATVAVVGCTGSVGVAASRLLAAAGYGLVLIGRSERRVERELPDLAGGALVSADWRDAARADVVMLMTNDPNALLAPDMPRPGAVVVDFAHPANVDRRAYPEFARRGVAVVQGGLVEIPGYWCTIDLNLPDRRCTLACLAETYLFAREGIHEHSVGHATTELAAHLDQVAPRHGVRPRPLGLSAPGAPAQAADATQPGAAQPGAALAAR